jgi:hypothetical protein
MKIDTTILKFLYRKKNDGLHYDVSLQFPKKTKKSTIDNYVVELEKNGYVDKLVEGYLPESALTLEDNPNHANNSICKITSIGIDYFENQLKFKRTYFLSILAVFISLTSIIFTILTHYFKGS